MSYLARDFVTRDDLALLEGEISFIADYRAAVPTRGYVRVELRADYWHRLTGIDERRADQAEVASPELDVRLERPCVGEGENPIELDASAPFVDVHPDRLLFFLADLVTTSV